MHIPKCCTPMSTSYHPSEDVKKELNVEVVQFYQELIGILQWAVENGRVDLLLEVSLLLSHTDLPIIRHLHSVYHILRYLKQVPKRKLYFDRVSPLISEDRFHKFDSEDFYRDSNEAVPEDIQNPRGKINTTYCFLDAIHAAN